jgi:hypothetical protein
MYSRLIIVVTALALIGAFGGDTAFGQMFVVDAHSPAQNEINVSPWTNIVVDFNMEVYTPSIGDTTFIAYGNMTGRHFGTITFDNSNYTAILDPDEDFAPGEIVTVIVKRTIRAEVGPDFLLIQSYVWTFTVDAASGLGSIYPRTDYALPNISIPYGLAPGDYDGDGDIDIAACGWVDMLSLLINGGTGKFSPGANQNIIGTLPHDIVASDMNMDGFIDLSSANQWNDSVAVLVNNDIATFFLRDQKTAVNNPNDIASSDFNGDGMLDLAVVNRNANVVSVYFNMGSGHITEQEIIPVGLEPWGIYAADFNNDWTIDLIVTNRGGNSMTELFNDGWGFFNPIGPTPVGTAPTGVITAILDDDNYPDHAIANYADATITIFFRDALGIHGSAIVPTQITPRYIVPVDIDGDDDLDLAVCHYDPSQVSIHLNDGFGNFAGPSLYTVDDSPYRIKAADVDGDGDMELMTVNYYGQDVTIIGPMPIMVVTWGDVNVIITDPSGLQYGLNEYGVPIEEIPTGFYYNTPDHDSAVIHEPILGPYIITFVEDLTKGGDKAPVDLYAGIIKTDGTQSATVVAGDMSKGREELYVYDYNIEEGYHYLNGDANRDEDVNVGDAVFLINYVFKNGPAPYPELAGDANCDHDTNIGDAVYIINFVFKGGNKPCCCELCGDSCN